MKISRDVHVKQTGARPHTRPPPHSSPRSKPVSREGFRQCTPAITHHPGVNMQNCLESNEWLYLSSITWKMISLEPWRGRRKEEGWREGGRERGGQGRGRRKDRREERRGEGGGREERRYGGGEGEGRRGREREGEEEGDTGEGGEEWGEAGDLLAELGMKFQH